MMEWLWPLLLIAAYVVLMRWILPRLGVQTWMANSCRVESRRAPSKIEGSNAQTIADRKSGQEEW